MTIGGRVRQAMAVAATAAFVVLPRAGVAQSPQAGPGTRQAGQEALPTRPAPSTVPGTELTISLLTMGTGAEIWELFGHNGIWIHDERARTDLVYNWGVFDFRASDFLPRFLQGTMLYRVDTMSLAQTLYGYRYLNRSVWAQELNLTPAERVQIRDFVQWNMLPQNQFYRYNYFTDNCSTRVRDLLDHVLRGQLRSAAAARLTNTTYRSEALRLMQGGRFLVVGVDIGLGEPSDHRLTSWDDMFLPARLRDFVRSLAVTDTAGRARPLVAQERALFQASRPPEPATVPGLFLPLLAIGVVVGAGLAGLAARDTGASRITRRSLTVVAVAWSIAAGLLGVILTLLWTATDHVFSYRNENLLLFNPLWLVLAVLLPMSIIRDKAKGATKGLALGLAVAAIVALFLHVVRLSSQTNGAVIALAMPATLALAWIATRHSAGATAER